LNRIKKKKKEKVNCHVRRFGNDLQY